MTMFSGLVCVGWLRSAGSCTGTVWVTTGMVIRKMISNTSMTSTSGVVLIEDITSSSSDGEPSCMAMACLLARCASGRLLHLGFDAAAGEQDGVQVGGEGADFFHRRLVAADDEVVAHHRGHRDGEADGGHGVIDAPHGAEQADEGRGGAHRGQHGEAVLQAALDFLDRAAHR